MPEPPLAFGQVDPADDATLTAYGRIQQEAEAFGNDYPTPFRTPELRVLLSGDSTMERWTGYLGYDGSRPVVAGLIIESLLDNLDKARLGVWVAPEDRRRGYGAAMAGELVRRAAAQQRTTLLAGVDYPLGADESHPDRAFAVRHGFVLSNAELHRVLDLPVAPQPLAELAAQAAPHHRDFRLIDCMDGDVPDNLLSSYVELGNAIMTDSPTGDVEFEPGAETPETFARDVAVMQAMGRTLYRTIAIDARGSAAAHNVLCVPGHDPDKIFQFDTLVRREHRGHRLGLAVKVRNLAEVQRRHPERRIVHTWNAASNGYMIAINDAMGFRVVNECAEYVRG